jgi:hypothetical protein
VAKKWNHRWTWPEYQAVTDAVDRLTGRGVNKHPGDMTLGEIFGEGEPEPLKTAEQKAAEERREKEIRERIRRTILWEDLIRIFSYKLDYLLAVGRDEGELRWFEKPSEFTPELIGQLAFPTLSGKKLANRIKRLEDGSQEFSELADVLEGWLEEQSTIRRIK